MNRRGKIKRIAVIISYVTQTIGTIIVISIIGHFIIGSVILINRSLFPQKEIISPVYNDYDRKIKVAYEQGELNEGKTVNKPYYHWKGKEYKSEYVNINQYGRRKTIKSPVKDAKKVFIFGGSTTWGEGVPDEFTFPSLLQKELGAGYDVYNYGEAGFNSVQELNLLLEELAKGNIPDYVIFYDGINDGYAGVYSPGIPRGLESIDDVKNRGMICRLYELSNYSKLVEYVRNFFDGNNTNYSQWDLLIKDKIIDNSRNTIKYYIELTKQVKALSQPYHFKCYFFWQPNLLTMSRKMMDYEKEIVQRESRILIEARKQLYNDAKEQLGRKQYEDVFFLGNIFDEVKGPIYIDDAHVGPQGNELVAQAIYSAIWNNQS